MSPLHLAIPLFSLIHWLYHKLLINKSTNKLVRWLLQDFLTIGQWSAVGVLKITQNITLAQQATQTASHSTVHSYPDFSTFAESLSSRTKIARSFPRLAISLRPTPLTFGNATNRSLLTHWYKDSSMSSISTGTKASHHMHSVSDISV